MNIKDLLNPLILENYPLQRKRQQMDFFDNCPVSESIFKKPKPILGNFSILLTAIEHPLGYNRLPHYSFKAVELRFEKTLAKLIQYRSLNEAQLNDLKDNKNLKTKAKKLADFFKRNFKKRVKQIKTCLEIKNQRPVKKLELDAKIYSLALRVQAELSIHTSENLEWANLSERWETAKSNQKAPHIKLLGLSSHKLWHIKSRNVCASIHLLYGTNLGSGSYNQVNSVYHLEDAQEFACRELKSAVMQDHVICSWTQEVINHFQLNRLNIRGIVKLHDVYQLDQPFKRKALLLEKCDGDLFRIPKELADSVYPILMKQLIISLIKLHKNNYVHQDLKPANVFYKHENNQIEIKIGDFGLLTKQGTEKLKIGTYFYQPYEAFYKNQRMVLTSCDCWAAGMIAYHLKYVVGSNDLIHGPYLNENYVQLTHQMSGLYKNIESLTRCATF
jgi:Protein kinase domain